MRKSNNFMTFIALFMCIYGLDSHLKCSFKSILEKKHENFFLWSLSFVCRTWSFYQSAPILRNLFCPVRLWHSSCLSILIFVPISTWVFANLPIYRKLIHENIHFVFWKPRIYCLVLFWRRYKIICTYSRYLH